MRNKNYYINLNDREYLDVLSSLMNKRNKLIQSGKYTDGIDEVIMKIKKAKKRTFRVLYSHIIDEDRRLNAQRFEETFYQKKNPSEVNGATVEPKKEPQGITEEAMLNYMVQNPDFLQKFKVLLGVGN